MYTHGCATRAGVHRCNPCEGEDYVRVTTSVCLCSAGVALRQVVLAASRASTANRGCCAIISSV